MKLRVDPGLLHGFESHLHDPPVGDAVPVTDTGIGGRIAFGILAQPRVLHDDRTGTGQITAAKGFCTVRPQPRRHSRSCRAAPEGVAIGVHFQFVRMVKDEADGSCQILTGSLCAGAINESEGVVALLGKLQRMREAVLHGPHIGKGTACIADGELLAGDSLEEKQSRILLGRFSRLFLVGVDVIEDGLAVRCPLSQGVHDLHRFVRVDVAVIGQPEIFQRIAAVIGILHRKQQPSVRAEHWVMLHIFNFTFPCKCCRFGRQTFHRFLRFTSAAAAQQKRRTKQQRRETSKIHIIICLFLNFCL